MKDGLRFTGRGRGYRGRKACAAEDELRVIKGVEQLGANLRFESLMNGEVFDDSQIEVFNARAMKSIARQ